MVQFASLTAINNSKTPCPVHASLKASSTSIVHGCPGVPRSIPRIETVIELRPANGIPFTCRSIGVELRTIQKVSVPSTIGSNDTFREYKIYEDPLIYAPPIGEFSQELLAIDIPILIPLPKDIISSGQFPHWNASTIHKLLVKITCGNSHIDELSYIESFPVVIKLYDTLPLYRQYNEPIIESRTSYDNQVIADISLPISSVGPKDELIVFTKIMTNALNYKINKRLRLKQLTMQVKEILECHEGGLPVRKEHKLYSNTQNFEDQLLNSSGISYEFHLDFPVENDYLQLYSPNNSNLSSSQTSQSRNNSIDEEVSHSTAYFYKNRNFDKISEGVPITHVQGFTTLGKLFSIKYETIIKVKLNHAKDMEIHLPFTVSTYDRISSDYLLKWIMKECQIAKMKFGKKLINKIALTHDYDNMVNLLRNFNKPPVVYRYTRQDWVRLGFNLEAFGNNDKSLVDYID